jgi:hypothetical protein
MSHSFEPQRLRPIEAICDKKRLPGITAVTARTSCKLRGLKDVEELNKRGERREEVEGCADTRREKKSPFTNHHSGPSGFFEKLLRICLCVARADHPNDNHSLNDKWTLEQYIFLIPSSR